MTCNHPQHASRTRIFITHFEMRKLQPEHVYHMVKSGLERRPSNPCPFPKVTQPGAPRPLRPGLRALGHSLSTAPPAKHLLETILTHNPPQHSSPHTSLVATETGAQQSNAGVRQQQRPCRLQTVSWAAHPPHTQSPTLELSQETHTGDWLSAIKR